MGFGRFEDQLKTLLSSVAAPLFLGQISRSIERALGLEYFAVDFTGSGIGGITIAKSLGNGFTLEYRRVLEQFAVAGEWEQALSKARPILEGRQSCAEIPHLTFGTLLYPLFKLGRLEQARDIHRRGYALVGKNREFLATVGEHLEFLALTDNLSRGLTLVERHLGWALDHPSHRDRFAFYAASAFLLERVQLDGGRDVVSLRLPKAFAGYRDDGGYEVKALHAWVHGQAREIASRFDLRNGTDRFARLLARNQTLADEARPFAID